MVLETLLDFFFSLSFIYLIIIFLPLLIQLGFQMLTSMINSLTRFDITPIINILMLPGSLLRLTFVWLIFEYFGYEFRLRLYFPYFGRPASNVGNSYNYRGMTGAPARHRLAPKLDNLKVSMLVTLASYSVMVILILWVVFFDEITYSLQFLLPYHLVTPIYFYILISLLLGGMPVPEETMSTVYVFIMEHPQLVVMVMLNTLGALILTPYIGVTLTMIYWLAMTVLGYYIWYIYEHIEYEVEEEPDIVADQQLVGGI